MTFLSPQALWLLLAIPVLALLYLWQLKRRSRAAVRYANLPLVREALGKGPGLRRHIPPILFLVALTVMLLAVARPAAVITLASKRATVLLAMDVSGSMRARDVEPDRITASKAAAKEFIRGMPKEVRIGIVAFAGTAFLVQSPTTVKEDLEAAIDRFELQRGTATGSGILVSLQNLFPEEDIDLGPPRMDDPFGGVGAGAALGQAPAAKKPKPAPVPPGSNESGLIIVMTDGQTTTGVDPVEAARVAADHGIRVFTVGFGSADGEVVGWGGWSMRTQLDEASLKQIADMTKGQYFRATTTEELKKIYQGLNTRLIKERRETEITSAFAAVAAALAMAAAALSMLWYSRIL